MAVSPPVLAEGLAADILEQYAEAERILLERIAKSLAKGIDGPEWAQQKLIEIHTIQARAKKLLKDMEGEARDIVETAINTAVERGVQAADRDMIGVIDEALNPDTSRMPGSRAVTRLVAETTDKVIGTHPRILRSTTDIYRSVVMQASSQVLLGTETVRTVTQRALDVFARKGVTGLIDKAGRGWSMEAYTEMAVRTSTAHAAVAAHMDRLQEAGLDLILISNAPAECSRCRPWEGKVLSISGLAAGTEAVATLEEATAAGLFHPNCRHSTALYQPGITKPLTDTEDPQGDADRQKLRDLERKVREDKRVRAVAMDSEAVRKADLRIRGHQAQIREHVNTTTATRQPHREQLGVGKPAAPPISAPALKTPTTSFSDEAAFRTFASTSKDSLARDSRVYKDPSHYQERKQVAAALDNYQMEAYQINDALRTEDIYSEVEKAISGIDYGINSVTTDRPYNAVRVLLSADDTTSGINTSFKAISDNWGDVVGSVIEDKGFLSASMRSDFTWFEDLGEQVRFHIDIPTGSHAILAVPGGSNGLAEVILPRGSRLEVKRAWIEEKVRHLEVVLLPPN